MKYAVISLGGTQVQVQENQTITTDKLPIESGKEGTVDQVLLVVDDSKVEVGTPTVKGATVKYEVVKHFQGEKLDINTFKAKSRYRRHMGFRAQLCEIKITKISL